MGKGGLGLRDFHSMNQALLAKTAWRIHREPQSLISKELLGKYCHNKKIWTIKATQASSWGWKGIIWGKDLLARGIKWCNGDGSQINIFSEQWIPNMDNLFVSDNGPPTGVDLQVSHLYNPVSKQWRIPLIRSIFPTEVVPNILLIHIRWSPQQDRRIWPFTKNGNYSVKSGYFFNNCLH